MLTLLPPCPLWFNLFELSGTHAVNTIFIELSNPDDWCAQNCLPGNERLGNIRVHESTVTDIQGSQNLRQRKEWLFPWGYTLLHFATVRQHLAFLESWDSSFHLSNILSSWNSYLLSFILTWAGQGAAKNWQMGAERHFEEDITCSVKATVKTYILCLLPPLPLTHLCIALPRDSNLRYCNWQLPWNGSAKRRVAITGAFKILA